MVRKTGNALLSVYAIVASGQVMVVRAERVWKAPTQPVLSMGEMVCAAANRERNTDADNSAPRRHGCQLSRRLGYYRHGHIHSHPEWPTYQMRISCPATSP